MIKAMASMRLILLCTALAGCASVGQPYWVKAWAPATEISIVRVGSVLGFCPPEGRACAKRFDSGACNVYLGFEPYSSLKPDPAAKAGFAGIDELEHELCHCLGYDHPNWSVAVGAPCPVDVRTADRLIKHRSVASAE